jgi:nitrate reductase gamma subunit
MMTIGFVILVYRRAAIPRVRATTSRGDLVMYPLLTIALVTGMIATFGANLVSPYHYREVVSPWFCGIFTFRPHAEEMAGAPFLFQLHVTCVWLLYAVWPFSCLVHAWSIPLTHLQRSWILYRSRNPRAALAFERSRVSQERARP